MDCVQFSNLLDNYANLDKHQLSELEAHALVCDKCKSELDFFKSMMSTIASLPQPEPPVGLLERINSEIDSIDTSSESIHKGIIYKLYSNITRYSTFAACIVIALVVGANDRMFNDVISSNNEGIIGESIKTVDYTTNQSEVSSYGEIAKSETFINENDVIIPTQKPKATAVPTLKPSHNKINNSSKSNTTSGGNAVNQPSDILQQPVVSQKPDATHAVTPPNEISESQIDENANSMHNIHSEDSKSSGDTEQYTIAQKYRLPDNYSQPTVSPTESADVDNYSITSDNSDTAYGYNLSTNAEKQQKVVADQLIINSEYSDKVILILSTLDVQSTETGYSATLNVFADLLVKLNSEEIDYSYISNNAGADVIPFKLIFN